MWIDSHCHLANPRFDNDINAVVGRALEAGVGKIVVPATDHASAVKALALSEQFEALHVAVGVHPCDVDGLQGNAWVEDFARLCEHPKVAAVGEIGLDFYHPPPAGWGQSQWWDWQMSCLRLQLDLAAAKQLPVVLHQRLSMPALRQVMQEYQGRVRAVFHCFTGGLDEARELISQGHRVSFTGLVTFAMRWRQTGGAGRFEVPPFLSDPAAPLPSGAASLAAVEPLRALAGLEGGGFMLETDAPYLAPQPVRGKRCEPAHVVHTAEAAALVRGCSLDWLAEQTTACARGFFRGL